MRTTLWFAVLIATLLLLACSPREYESKSGTPTVLTPEGSAVHVVDDRGVPDNQAPTLLAPTGQAGTVNTVEVQNTGHVELRPSGIVQFESDAVIVEREPAPTSSVPRMPAAGRSSPSHGAGQASILSGSGVVFDEAAPSPGRGGGPRNAAPPPPSGSAARTSTTAGPSRRPTPGDAYAYPNTEEYADFEQNRFTSVMEKPLSTFGADVDTASYSIFRRQVYNGNTSFGLLRTEEMVNYFRYDYPQPKKGEPFSITAEMTPCPWNPQTKLLRLGLATRHIASEDRPASNFVFLVDVSGSMSSEDRLPLLQKALLILVDQMRPEDRISIVTYASYEKLVLDGATYKDRDAIKAAINSLRAGGSTNGERGIQMAYEVAQRHFIKGGNNRIIMGTDGDLNVGISSESELKRFIADKRKTGVFLSVFGFGQGNLKDSKMTALAKNGNGNYSYIDTIIEARRVLQTELSSTLFVAAKDVKFQVDFNPGKVKGYRLIGYESRKLNAEDFADDKKDGGEIGAGHQVTVLYEIIDSNSDYAFSTESRYQKPMQVVDSNEWFTLKIRYKDPDGDKSRELVYPTDNRIWRDKMSPDMVFASAIAQVAMIANKSDYVGTATLDSVVAQLLTVPAFQNDELKAEFVSLVRRLRGLS